VQQLVHYLVHAAGRNANFLLKIGPMPDGTIDPEMVRRLEGIGTWMTKHGHTITGTRGGPTGPQPWGTSTHSADTIYLHILDPSSADVDGWLTLTGTESLRSNNLREAVGDATVTSRRDADGRLQVKVKKSRDAIDLVIAARIPD
jgi:alpha-L-fucosidase